MTNIQNKASVFAVKEETTEGTPVWPDAAGDFVALQEDASMTPSFEELSSAEFKNSIGMSKSIKGAENPTGTFSHYLRNSGVAATAPGYHLFCKGWFGSSGTRSTERDTVAGSTTSSINVDSGEGTEFARGHFLLVKDSTNGYSIACVKSVSTDALTPLFNLANAPASGVNLGRDTRYLPVQSGHPSLSTFKYWGNSGAIEMISGAKVTEFSFTATAGQLLNANFSYEGLEYFWNPVEITSSNNKIDFDDDGATEQNVTITAKTYKTPTELADAIAAAMNGATNDTITVTYSSSDGKFTIASDGSTLNLLWKTGTNGADGTDEHVGSTIGFSDAADDSGATTYEADDAMDWSASYTPDYDDADPLSVKSHEVLLGTATDNSCFEAMEISVAGTNSRTVNGDICATSGRGSAEITAREVTVSVQALLQQYDEKQFDRFKENTEIAFQYNFGTKTGGNWDEGKSGAFAMPTATITEINVANADNLAQLNMTLKAFVNDDAEGEVYLGFV